MERTEVGAQDFGAAEHRVEVAADDSVATTPLTQSAVAPQDRVVAIKQDNAVRHSLEDAVVLHQPAYGERFFAMTAGDEHASELFAGETSKRTHSVRCADNLIRFGQALKLCTFSVFDIRY